MITDETKELLAGLLQGANINHLNILTGEHAQVSYQGGDGPAMVADDTDNDGGLHLPKRLDTPRARKYFARALEKKYMETAGNGRYRWIGTGDRGGTSQLAYFLGRVYNYRHTISGNAGEDFPEDDLNELFGVTRLYSSLTQVYNAQKPQRWRALIDALFE